jgi:SAM-dependent methyltransferase
VSTANGADSGSAERSRAFYRALGASGLAIRTKPEWDEQIVGALLELLPPAGRVLDVGCGYGRIAIPLAGLGYEVTGFDVSRNLLRAARRDARARGLAVRFDEGSMTILPYEAGSFDAVICLWTAFHELLEEAEQVAALGEMFRVLRPGGRGVIDGPAYAPATDAEIASGARRGPDHGVVSSIVAGHRMSYVAHDPGSFERLANAAGIGRWQVVVRDWAGRDRQLMLFRR